MKKALLVSVMMCLSACSATPKINIIDSMGMTMELNRSAKIPNTLAISSDGRYGLSAGFDNIVRLWDLSDGKLSNGLRGTWGVYGIQDTEFSPDGTRIVAAGHDKAIRLWDVSSGKEIRQFIGHKGDLISGVVIQAATFSPDGRKLVSRAVYDDMILWDVETGTVIRTFPDTQYRGLIVKFTPDGRYVLYGKDGALYKPASVSVLDTRTGRQFKKFDHGHSFASVIFAADVSRDGKYVLSGGSDGFIKIWDMYSGEAVRVIKAHPGINGVTSAQFSPDGKFILSGGGDNIIKLWDVASGHEVRRLVGHSKGPIGFLKTAISGDGKRALSDGTDASVRLWDISTGEERGMMVGFEDGEWLVITKEGYYNASAKGAQYLTVKMDDKDYTVDQFYDVFYRPDIVTAKLRGENITDLVTLTMQDAIKNPPPVVDITQVVDTGPTTKVCFHAKSAGGGIGEVRLFHNGKLIQSDGYYRDMAKSSSLKHELLSMNSKAIYENMRSVAVKGTETVMPTTSRSKGDTFSDCKEIDAVPGENDVSITAFNSGNTVQSAMKTATFNSTIKSDDPHLYILSIGIDAYKDTAVNLKYAAKDAADIAQKLRTQSATIYKPQNIHAELLTNENAGKGNIINTINELSRKIRPNDGFILFVAGHGVLLQNQYYMLTHDYDGNVNDTNIISSNEIVEMSKRIKSLSQLFMFDTCHAGGVDTIVSGLYDARMSVLAKKMGLHIYASANSIQEALDGYQGNGLFTYTLLDGLNNKKEADKNSDNTISVVELGEYAKQTTTEISRKSGHAQTPLIINFGKDAPVYNLR
jgi:WD40 repeat protein